VTAAWGVMGRGCGRIPGERGSIHGEPAWAAPIPRHQAGE
jgi:hypothetical protein